MADVESAPETVAWDTAAADLPRDDETAVVPDALRTEGAELAWSAEVERIETTGRSWRQAWGRAAILLAVAAVAASGIGLADWLLTRDDIPVAASAEPTPKPADTQRPRRGWFAPPTTPSAAKPSSSPTVAAVPSPAVVTDPAVTDRAFIRALERANINVYNRDSALKIALWVCDRLRAGYTQPDIAAAIKAQDNPDHPLEVTGAIMFVNAAVGYYCPQYARQY
ncbi:DUF732 domain-containing protein [Mycobacterium haemophilum]